MDNTLDKILIVSLIVLAFTSILTVLRFFSEGILDLFQVILMIAFFVIMTGTSMSLMSMAKEKIDARPVHNETSLNESNDDQTVHNETSRICIEGPSESIEKIVESLK